MDRSDPLYWLIMGLALLIAVLALREPLHKDPGQDRRDPAWGPGSASGSGDDPPLR